VTHRVLIVEDDHDTREMLGHFLELEGYEVEKAANGREALDALRAADDASAILLDLMMPVMDGWQFRAVQRQDESLARIPVVVLTAAGARDRMPPIDADAWLAKPVDLDVLLDTLAPFCSEGQ
jgi:CheY-like chemotaxis protein